VTRHIVHTVDDVGERRGRRISQIRAKLLPSIFPSDDISYPAPVSLILISIQSMLEEGLVQIQGMARRQLDGAATTGESSRQATTSHSSSGKVFACRGIPADGQGQHDRPMEAHPKSYVRAWVDQKAKSRSY
jgi:hypothetical protein